MICRWRFCKLPWIALEKMVAGYTFEGECEVEGGSIWCKAISPLSGQLECFPRV